MIEVLICDECHNEFDDESDFMEHACKLYDEDNDISYYEKYECEFCYDRFETKDECDEHEEYECNQNDDRIISCKECVFCETYKTFGKFTAINYNCKKENYYILNNEFKDASYYCEYFNNIKFLFQEQTEKLFK